MSKLYVCNATRQIQEFTYRLPERPGAKMQTVPIGGQVVIGGGELTTPDIDYIIEHHKKYGLVSFEEVEQKRTEFSGMCYSIDRPITSERIERAMKRNIDLLEARGKQIRREAAVAANDKIEHDLADSGLDAGITGLEMSIQEEEPKRGDREGQRISEGIRVTRTEESSDTPRPSRARRRG